MFILIFFIVKIIMNLVKYNFVFFLENFIFYKNYDENKKFQDKIFWRFLKY